MSIIETLKRQRNPYTLEGRVQEILCDLLIQLEITNESLGKAMDILVSDVKRGRRDIDTRRRVIPRHLLESVTELVRLSEERAQTIDHILDLCHTLELDSVDLLEEFWGENK